MLLVETRKKQLMAEKEVQLEYREKNAEELEKQAQLKIREAEIAMQEIAMKLKEANEERQRAVAQKLAVDRDKTEIQKQALASVAQKRAQELYDEAQRTIHASSYRKTLPSDCNQRKNKFEPKTKIPRTK